MRFDDRSADRQSQPQTARFRRVEGVKQEIERRRRQARTGVLHLDQHALRFVPGADEYLSLSLPNAAHGLDRIEDQVEYYLLQLDPISLDRRQAFCELRPYQHTIVRCFGAGQRHDFENCVVDGDRILPRRRFFYERADPPDDLARSITILYDTSERLAHLAEIRWFRAHPAQGGLRVCDCRWDRLVHFMGDRGRQLAHRRDAVGVRQRHLRLAILPGPVDFCWSNHGQDDDLHRRFSVIRRLMRVSLATNELLHECAP